MKTIFKLTTQALLFAAILASTNVQAGLTDIADAPLASSGFTSVKPNLMFILDNSGSMTWDYMPDKNNSPNFPIGTYGYASSQCNGVYYSSNDTYTLPVHSDGISYATSTFTAAPVDGFGTTTSATVDLSAHFNLGQYTDTSPITSGGGAAFYYNYTGSQTTPAQKKFGNPSSTFFQECNSSIPAMTITVSGVSTSTSISSIKIDGVQVLTGSSNSSSSNSNVASAISSKVGNGFTASRSGSVVSISYPADFTHITAASTVTYTVASGGATLSSSYVCASPGCGVFTGVTVSSTSGPGGTDERTNFANWYTYYRTRILAMKSAAGLAFNQIDNRYRVGFSTISYSGTSSTNAGFLKIADFDSPQKTTWYAKLYGASGNSSTPLRGALSKVGRMYAGQLLTGADDPMQYSCQQNFTLLSTDGYWNAGTESPSNPSGDGCVTNTASSTNYGPRQIDNKTCIGQQDADEVRPMFDGGGAHYTKNTSQTLQSQSRESQTTSQLQKRIVQQQISTSTLQSQTSTLQTQTSTLQSSTSTLLSSTSTLQSITSNLQSSTMYLQTRTSSNSGSSWTGWSGTASCTWDNSSSSRRQCRYVTASGGSTVWSTAEAIWANVASCTTNFASGTSGTWSGNGTSCQYADSSPVNVSSCTSVAKDTTSPYSVATATTCAYSAWTAPGSAASCTYQNQSSSSPYSVGTARQCSYSAWSSPANVSSCTASSQTTSTADGTVYNTAPRQCSYSAWSTLTATASCTAVPQDYIHATARNCQYSGWSSWANTGSCTSLAQSSGPNYTVGTATQCQYTPWSAYSNGSCTVGTPQSPASPYTVGTATQCQSTDTGWVGASSCTPSSSGGQTVTCQGPVVTGPTFVASCSAQSASSGNNWTTTTCSTTTIQSATPVASCTATSPNAGNNYTTTTCTPNNTGPTTVTSCTAASPTAANNWTTTTCSAPTYSGGSANSMADIAEYFWKTDLRTAALGNCTGALGTDVCQDNVPGAGADVNSHQHMTTFTLGLGVDGLLTYAPDYQSGGSADFNDIKNDPPGNNWPDPISNTDEERIDDLWHAAVDGRGVYYSASNPTTLVTGLSNALAGVTARLGAAAAAATSSLEPVAGDNYLFIAQFETGSWTGDLQARSINTVTGDVSATPIWSAQSLLDLRASNSSDTRSIYTYDSSASNGLKPFLWASLSGSEQALFNNMCSSPALLSQCSTLTVADQAAASGENLVNYLRGQKGNGGTLYRARIHVLGDMVNSQPQYVKAPPYSYVDAGYSDFSSAQSNRTPMVYVAANDGMLHAFAAETGAESWAYIPPMVLGNMYRLAENSYAANHRFLVDGSPVAGDVCPGAPASTCNGSQWKTLLVGGLNHGGRGYYALDITDPAAPKALWNFTSADDHDLGYTYGNPIIVKRKDGTWVVVVTSGYNNVSPGDGQGYLYVLNAYTGELLEKIGTGVGSTGTPSGLAKINVWLGIATDKTALRFYGGDLLGNVWRFTLDDGSPPASPVSTAGSAFLLAQVGQTNGAGNQPITTKPEVTIVNYGGAKYNVVEFGTGEYLGLTDLSDASQQSIYAIKDDLGATGLGLVRTPGKLVEQNLTSGTGANGQEIRTVTNNPVDWATKAGWFVDMNPSNMSPGERVNIDVQLNLGLLTVASNVPSDDACSVGGYAYLYYFDFKTGSYPSTAIDQEVGSRDPANALVAGMNFVYIQSPDGLVGVNIICTTDASCHVDIPPPPPPPSGGVKRFSWRELIQ